VLQTFKCHTCLQSFFRFWDVASFCINGMVFFFVGASVTNFLIRWELTAAKFKVNHHYCC
jgi:hypothetical protein